MAAAQAILMLILQISSCQRTVSENREAHLRLCMLQQEPHRAFESLSLVQLRAHGIRKTASMHQERSSSIDAAMVVPKNYTQDSAPASLVSQDSNLTKAAVPRVSELSVSAKAPRAKLPEERRDDSLSKMESKEPVRTTIVHGHNKLWLTSLMPQWGPNWVNEAALLNVVFLNVIFAVCFLCCSGHIADLADVKKR